MKSRWLGAAALAGLLLAPASAGVVNVDVSANGPADAASVPDVAVDPTDAKHLVVVWRSMAMPGPKDRPLACHMAVSRDGGVSFARRVLDWDIPGAATCNAPYVDFGAKGELYVGATLVEKGPLNPPEGYHAFGRAVIRKSPDGGHSWKPTVSVVDSGSFDAGKFAPDDSIPEVAKRTPWDGARGIVNRYNGDIYVLGGYPAPPGGAAHSQRFYSVSHDGGETWSRIRAMGSADWPQRWDSRTIAALGKMALAYIAGAAPGIADCLCVVFATSKDGTALKRSLVTQVAHMDTLVHYPPLAADPSRAGVYAIALVSDDRTALAIFKSSDDGAHWTNAASLPAPAGVVRVSRPAIAFAPEGVLVAMWRGQAGDGSYDVYMAAAPEGATFRAPVRVTTATSHPPDALKSDYVVRGDFINVMKIDSGNAYGVWTDWRTATEGHVMFARVPVAALVGSPRDGTLP